MDVAHHPSPETPHQSGRITGKTETIEAVTTTHTYTYDAAGRLTDEHRDGALVQRFTYDDNDNRTAHLQNNIQTTATYDAQDRLADYGKCQDPTP